MTVNLSIISKHKTEIAEASKGAPHLLRVTRDALARSASFKDPELSESALRQKRIELRDEMRAASQADLNKLRADIDWASKNLGLIAQENLPKIGQDPGSIMRAGQRWDLVKAQLAKGRTVRQALENADLDTVAATLEFGPDWVALRERPNEGIRRDAAAEQAAVRQDIAVFRRQVTARAIELSAPDVATALRAHLETAGQVASAEVYLEAAQAVIDGHERDGISTAITAGLAQQHANAGLTTESSEAAGVAA